MSWFKRSGSTAVGTYHRNNVGALPSASALHIRAAADSAMLLHNVHSLWNSVESVLSKQDDGLAGPSENETVAVLSFIAEVASSLECHNTTAHTQVTDFLLMVDAMNKLLLWSSRFRAVIPTESADRLYLLQLRAFDLLLNHSERCLLTEKRLIWPLLRLLIACGTSTNSSIEDQLALVLHQLCVGVSQYPAALELLFDTVAGDVCRTDDPSLGNNANQFLVFSLLVPYVHREGLIAQQARDDLLLIMSMSSSMDMIGRHIVDRSDFCPLLATGLSGLYSSLPRCMEYPSDDWNHITSEDITSCPAIGRFLNSLEFCNAVIQVAHPYVCTHLKKFVYDGFLVSVLGPALHQDSFKLPPSLRDSWLAASGQQAYSAVGASTSQIVLTGKISNFKSSMEEVIAATAYLELFIRKTSEPGLLRTFIDFVLNAHFDDVTIIDSLITRVFSIPRLCMVTLTLFKTLVDLNLEEVMFHLVFKYLVPCSHVMVSQQKCVRDLDIYCKVAEKLISLMPSSCHLKLPTDTCTSVSEGDESQSDSGTISTVMPGSASSVQSPRITTTVLSPFQRTGVKIFSSFRRKPRQASEDTASLDGSIGSGDSVRVVSTPPSTPVHSSFGLWESSYMEYLLGARTAISACIRATSSWSALYDGENPPPTMGSSNQSEKSTLISDPFCVAFPRSSEIDSNEKVSGLDAAIGKNGQIEPSTLGSDVVLYNATGEVLNDSDAVMGDRVMQDPFDESKAESQIDAGVNCSSDDNANDCVDGVVEHLNGKWVASESSGYGNSGSNAATDSLDVFLRHLAHIPAKGDETSSADLFTEFDALVEQLSKKVSESVIPGEDLGASVPSVTSLTGSSDCVDSSDSSLNQDGTSQTCDARLKSTKALQRVPESVNIEDKMSSGSPLASVVSTASDVRAAAVSKTEVLFNEVSSSGSPFLLPSSFAPLPSPTSNSLPSIGPFLTSLLGKLELMVQNPLYVNLQLTGLLARLACFPQPLLKSLLLSHSLVFQPSIKSLLQVLSIVKYRLDSYLLMVPDHENLLMQAGQYLLWRDDCGRPDSAGDGLHRRDSIQITPARQPVALLTGDKKKASTLLSDFWRRTSIRGTEPLVLDRRGAHFINRQGSPVSDSRNQDPLEVRTKNAVYCAIVFKEFVKELAAISQEHVLIQAYCGNT